MPGRYNFTRRNPKTKKIENTGYMEIRNVANGAELYIYGDIVSSAWDVWCDEVCPQDITDFMAQVDNNADLTVYINSGGGDVFAGIAIHSILKRHKGHKKGVVDGIAASIASVILMACDEIVMASGAQLMIHKPSAIGWGNADDFAKLIDELNKCQQSITEIYMENVKEGVTVETITEKINAETWMNGAEAQELFDITVEERPAIAACVSWMYENYRNRPQDIQTETIEDVEKRQQDEAEAAEILEDLYMYGI